MKPSPCVFMIAYCLAYGFAFAMDWPLFRYYPRHGMLSWGAAVLEGEGPAMAWYGLLTDAFIFAFGVSLLVPDRILGRFVIARSWIFPFATMAYSVYLLRALLF